jgi:polysaccharide export outer membrane protein
MTIAAAICCAVAASADAPVPSGAATAVPAGDLPPPGPNGEVADEAHAYRIGPYDTLDIAVFQVDMLNRSLTVDGTGHIEFPIIGEIMAAGKTAKQLSDEIAADLGKSYLTSPQVSVYVKDSASQKFTVEGAVKASGIFPLQGRMTLLRAIATAQGVADDAKQRDVVIFRNVDNRRMAGVINLGDVRKGKAGDPQIYAGDVIVVPVSGSRRAFKDLITASPLLFFFHP